jgi:hypothetical protein
MGYGYGICFSDYLTAYLNSYSTLFPLSGAMHEFVVLFTAGSQRSSQTFMEIVDSAESMLLVSFMAGSHCWMDLLIVNAVKSLFDDTESQFGH